MIERNAVQANMIANAVEVLENLQMYICQKSKCCEDCPLGCMYDTFKDKICTDVKRTAGELMLARRVVEKL